MAVDFSSHIVDLPTCGYSGVCYQRPWSGRPDEQRVTLPHLRPTGRLLDKEPHVHRRVHHVAVSQGHLVRGQRGAAAGAVGHDLVTLIQQLALMDLLQRPPHRLDVIGVQCAIGVLQVDPEADALGQTVPLLQIRPHRLPALGVEPRDPIRLDLVLAGDPQFLLHPDLHRQAVAVPAALALHLIAAHRLVARVDVLEHARQHVVRARAPVGGGGSLIEHPRLRSLAQAHGLREDVALAPALQDLQLQRGQILARVHLAGGQQLVARWGCHGGPL